MKTMFYLVSMIVMVSLASAQVTSTEVTKAVSQEKTACPERLQVQSSGVEGKTRTQNSQLNITTHNSQLTTLTSPMATAPMQNPRFTTEHVALNVPDPLAMVDWYKKHFGMTVKRGGGPPTHTAFIADISGNILLELFVNTAFPMLDLYSLHQMSFHLAFMTNDIVGTKEALVRAGSGVVEDVSQAPSGDQFLMMRDPWGLSLQFVQRASPMLPHVHLRPEHVAFNVHNSPVQARWYQEHLGMKVKREGGAPGFGFFLADAEERMMLELYQNQAHPMIDLPNTSYMSLHFAFMVTDVASARQRLLAAGATIADDLTTIPSGDVVLMMRDPWGLALQCVKRVEAMI